MEHYSNHKVIKSAYPNKLSDILCLNDTEQAYTEICQWPAYKPTPLHKLNTIATECNIGSLYYKDEGTRLGLGSFKALGGAYGVLKFLQKKLSQDFDRDITFDQIRNNEFKEQISNITVVTATDGNHGRSVAWGAKMFGAKCKIYIHAEVSEGRKKAMQELGATVIRIDGNYDQSVEMAANDANKNGWHIISDTSYEGYMEVPRDIMAGYTVLAKEIDIVLDETPPTHIFLQGGVGGLASAITAYFWERYGKAKPRIIVVEPDRAPCLIESAKAGSPTTVNIEQETIMAGLSCGKVSLLSWEILESGADDFITIGDDTIPDMVRLLMNGNDDAKIIAGESAVPGLAALMLIKDIPEIAERLELEPDSRVLLIGTEGATDPDIYNAIIQGKI